MTKGKKIGIAGAGLAAVAAVVAFGAFNPLAQPDPTLALREAQIAALTCDSAIISDALIDAYGSEERERDRFFDRLFELEPLTHPVASILDSETIPQETRSAAEIYNQGVRAALDRSLPRAERNRLSVSMNEARRLAEEERRRAKNFHLKCRMRVALADGTQHDLLLKLQGGFAGGNKTFTTLAE